MQNNEGRALFLPMHVSQNLFKQDKSPKRFKEKTCDLRYFLQIHCNYRATSEQKHHLMCTVIHNSGLMSLCVYLSLIP